MVDLCVCVQVLVNYTVATEREPDVFSASTNCQNSMHLHENYLLDKVLQDEFSELEFVRGNITQLRELIEFAEFVRENQRFFQPPSLPPPPPPSPAPPHAPDQFVFAPPAPPTLVAYDVYVQQLNHELALLQAREGALLTEIEGCSAFGGTRTRICGLPVVEGPNPWISRSGEPCRGNATLSARFGDFCGYWDSSYNVDAAPADEKNELLAAGAWCYADDLETRVLECDGRAQRTQRAGVFELAHWLRDDRRFCESNFFRSRIVPDPPASLSAEACRAAIAARNETCYKECDTCDAFCSSGLARGIKDTVKCTVDLPVLGITAAAHVSDAGQQISYGTDPCAPRAGRPPPRPPTLNNTTS